MYFGNELVADLPLDRELLTKPGYISAQKRKLLKEHDDLLQFVDKEPDFLITGLPRPAIHDLEMRRNNSL